MLFGLTNPEPGTNFYVWFGTSINQENSFKVSLLTLWPSVFKFVATDLPNLHVLM